MLVLCSSHDSPNWGRARVRAGAAVPVTVPIGAWLVVSAGGLAILETPFPVILVGVAVSLLRVLDTQNAKSFALPRPGQIAGHIPDVFRSERLVRAAIL